MLFDTQSPRRKRFVQIIFGGLALLMAGGLILFGIGGATSGGGLFDAFTSNNVSDVAKSAGKDAERAQAKLDANPKNEAAAADLARARLAIANADAFDPATGQLTEDGEGLINGATRAWDKYLDLGPAKPDPAISIQYANFFGQIGEYKKAQRAMDAVLITRKPSTGLYTQLVFYSLAAGDNARAKQARSEALRLAPSAERRKQVATDLDKLEKQIKDAIAEQAKAQEAEGGDGATGTTPLPTLPGLN